MIYRPPHKVETKIKYQSLWWFLHRQQHKFERSTSFFKRLQQRWYTFHCDDLYIVINTICIDRESLHFRQYIAKRSTTNGTKVSIVFIWRLGPIYGDSILTGSDLKFSAQGGARIIYHFSGDPLIVIITFFKDIQVYPQGENRDNIPVVVVIYTSIQT